MPPKQPKPNAPTAGPKTPKRGRRPRRKQMRSRMKLTPLAREAVSFGKGQSYDKLAQAIALPRQQRPVRFPQTGNSIKSCLFKLFADTTVVHQVLTNDPCDYTSILLGPSPVHPLWVSQVLSSTSLYSSTWARFATANNNNVTESPQLDWTVTSENRTGNYPRLGVGTFQSGQTYINAFYLPLGAVLTMNMNNMSGTGTSLTFSLQRVSALGYTVIDISGPITAGVTTATHTSAANGWVRLYEIRSNGTFLSTTTGLNISIAMPDLTRRVLLPAFTPIEEATLGTVLNDARCTAAAALFKNTTNKYYKGGTFTAARMPSNAFLPFDFPSFKDNIATRNSSDRYAGAGEQGLYTFATPSERSMTFYDYSFGGTLMFNVDDFEYYNAAIYVSSSVNPITSGITQEFELLFDTHLESRYNSQIFSLGVPTVPVQVYQDLLAATSMVCPFTENPLHLAALATLVSNLFKAAMPYIAPVARKGLKHLYNAADAYLGSY